MSTTSSTASVGTVPETIPAHTVKTDTATVEVSTSDYYFDAGVLLRVGVHVHGDRDVKRINRDEHRTHVGFTFNLTPDECDELAAMLVAHAFDRRRVVQAQDDRAEAEGVEA